MAMAPILGLAALVAGDGGAQGGPSILNGATAVPIGQEQWIDPIDDYPARARRDGQSGTVAARVFVDRMGRVTGCLIRETPNVLALEMATCRILRSRARFQPFGGGGLATFDYRIVWDLARLPPIRVDLTPLGGFPTVPVQ